ncbi:MAG: hypothetical protein RR630_05105, partial [Coprobacillus sp.]
MKKILLTTYLIFMFLISVLPLDVSNLKDSMNLLFLNTDSFPLFGLEKLNFQYIIIFMVFCFIIFNHLFSEVNETFSFLTLKMYRTSKQKFFNTICANYLRKCSVFMGVMMVLVICCYIFFYGFNINIEELLLLLIYAIKLFLVIYFITILYELFSVVGLTSKAYSYSLSLFVFILLTDIILGVHII